MLPEYVDSRSHSYVPSMVQQTVPRADPMQLCYKSFWSPRKENSMNLNRRWTMLALRDFHERYKAILNNIASIDNKISYMAFYRGLYYGNLKKELILDTPLTKDDLIRVVNKDIDLENMQRKDGLYNDL
ncbi:hypothetical protein LIER_09341 [Lithospermum erythrorhizon]|uniref:Uncharacterized protein n=1 Tax=Lithospermum erythrorhizon TaxID=34254 RepID=A0AAV3PGY4_LITER